MSSRRLVGVEPDMTREGRLMNINDCASQLQVAPERNLVTSKCHEEHEPFVRDAWFTVQIPNYSYATTPPVPWFFSQVFPPGAQTFASPLKNIVDGQNELDLTPFDGEQLDRNLHPVLCRT